MGIRWKGKTLGPSAEAEIIHYLDERVTTAEDSRQLGQALIGDLGGSWRYRVGDYRLICEQDQKLRELNLPYRRTEIFACLATT